MCIKTLWIGVFFIPAKTWAQSPITIRNSPKFKPENVMHDYAILEKDSGAYFYFSFQNKLNYNYNCTSKYFSTYKELVKKNST